jgi:pimeloyl-ACP methyl ester carboxylesterase
MIDKGQGSPIVLIPGIQGHYQWMNPAIDALAARHRVLSFSLFEKRASGVVFPELGKNDTRRLDCTPFDGWVKTIDAMLDAAGLAQAAIVGISFGGVIAAHYAANRPDRVSALVVASAPSPRWQPDARVARDVRHPLRALPGFVARAPLRLVPEVMAALSTWPARLRFGLSYAARTAIWRISPRAMAGWIQAWMATDVASGCSRIVAPTLVITGEPALDRVVPVTSTLDYLTLIRGARAVTLGGTGHVGCVSKPREFAALVGDFVRGSGLFSTVSPPLVLGLGTTPGTEMGETVENRPDPL